MKWMGSGLRRVTSGRIERRSIGGLITISNAAITQSLQGSARRDSKSDAPAIYRCVHLRRVAVGAFADGHGVCPHSVQPYFSAVALPQKTRYMNTV